MACTPPVPPPLPTLGGGLAIPPLPIPPLPIPGACCQLVTLPALPVNVVFPLPAAVLAVQAAIMNAQLVVMENYLVLKAAYDAAVKCPRSRTA